MKIYALKYKNDYYLFTQDKTDLDKYRTNKISDNVELEVVKNDSGRYWLFEGQDGEVIIESTKLVFDDKIKGLEGEISKVILIE